ncbi:hypothetical protein GF385_01740 [Candidatus Dependentiae bacterium]|nr:hypothetical protein [Candidatus Dependentiae bacterium]
MKKIRKILFIILFFLNLNAKKEIVIFIHGSIAPLTSIPTSVDELKELFGQTDTQEKTKFTNNILSRFYQRHLNQSRIDGIHKYQPISNLGLKKFGKGKNKKQLKIFQKLFTQSFKQVNPNLKHEFYTFGWDGRIDEEKRKKWAQILYKKLIKIRKKLKKQKETTVFQIYAHSHGGNVALNLSDMEKTYNKNLKIKNLVLFATPIQENASNLIKSDIFENIYHIYSEADYIQTMENKILSKTQKRFTSNNLPQKLKQIEVESEKQKPTHWELWFYGKMNSNFIQTIIYQNILYKKDFPLYPYPVSVFIPQTIRKINANKNLKNQQDLYLNISRTKKKNNFEIKITPQPKKSIQIEFKSA